MQWTSPTAFQCLTRPACLACRFPLGLQPTFVDGVPQVFFGSSQRLLLCSCWRLISPRPHRCQYVCFLLLYDGVLRQLHGWDVGEVIRNKSQQHELCQSACLRLISQTTFFVAYAHQLDAIPAQENDEGVSIDQDTHTRTPRRDQKRLKTGDNRDISCSVFACCNRSLPGLSKH